MSQPINGKNTKIENEQIEEEEYEEYEEVEENKKGGIGYIIFGLIFFALGAFIVLFKIIDGGGKAGEAFVFLALFIGAPSLLIGSLLLIAGYRRMR